MSSFTTCSSVDEFSPRQPIFPNLSPSGEMSVLIARIAELNRAKTIEPSVASSEASGQDGYAIFPNLSPSEEMSVLIARITELYRAKTIEPSVASSEVFGQDGYGMNDDQFSLDEEEEDEQQEESKTPTKDAAEERFLQSQNDQKKILEKISELEKQQKEQSKVTAGQLSKILEKISVLEQESKQRKASSNFRQNYWDANVCHKNLEITGKKNRIVHYKRNLFGCCSIFAKHTILLNNNSSDIFYYEISVKNMKCWMSFGFAVKQQNKLDGTIRTRKGTYAIDSDGKIWINGEGNGINAEYSYDAGDTLGIGIILATRQLFFTKNGKQLDSSGLFVASSSTDDSFHPFVSLRYSGDEIEANFGPNFEFDLDSLFSQLPNDQKKILEKEKQTQKEVLLKFQQNCWDAFACHKDIRIIDNTYLIVRDNNYANRSVFAKYPILLVNDSSIIFYYEISIKNKKSSFIFGFAVKQQTNFDDSIWGRSGTYAIGSYGEIWINGKRNGSNSNYSYGVGDTMGIGVNSATRQIIFTQNGRRLDSSDLLVASSFADDSFHPFISLRYSGDEIEANFGPNFKFDFEAL
ncbi:hypothetical protein niasHS_005044 [Heterodera schachtii]|uniref:B30.2/SPRY domain-containing protein n=1 Tax=Heterodera schachtii TaxID=97005 RepID=A0ABD2JKE8_HETSC